MIVRFSQKLRKAFLLFPQKERIAILSVFAIVVPVGEFRYKNNLAELNSIAKDVRSFCHKFEICAKDEDAISVCIEEAFCNIVSYAFEGDSEHTVKIALSKDEREITVTIEDDGIPFDPVKHIRTSLPEDGIEERQIGGLGLFLLKKLMDSIQYFRRGNCNVLLLQKKYISK